MIKLLIGGKGSGKTKALIELANKAVEESKGSVVCVEKGDALRLNVTSRARLISAEDYAICGADAFYGFIAGILSSNYHITDLFIDSSMKLCCGDVEAFVSFVERIEKITADVNVVISASIPMEECPEAVKKYI